MGTSKNRIIQFFLILLFACIASQVFGQLSGNNLMEYQFGNIPATKPADLSTLYDQLNLQYRQKNLKASIRLEQFYSTDSIKRDYVQVSQFLVQYRYKKIEMKVGNFYESFGRGLLFRSYEIPASIKEERSFRLRHGFYRDLQGVLFKYTGDIFRFKAIRGKPLDNYYPPGNDLQRSELIEAIQPEISLWNQGLGFIGMRYNSQGQNTWYGSMFLRGSLPWNFSYYGEYARNMTENSNIFEFGENDAFGTYLSLNHSYGSYGASIELKKYQNFLIGTGIGDPPTLVKEHSYRLLNRSTHVPELRNESGYQIEVYYSFSDAKMLTINNSQARNILFEDYTFREVFLEFYWPFSGGSYLKSFIDYSMEDINRENPRYAGGVYYTQMLKSNWSLGIESELQTLKREQAVSQPITNIYLGLVLNKSTKISASIYYEFTSDETIADKPNTDEIETKRNFFGVGFNYRPNQKNTFTAFVGERRGGPACNSGVCYEVLDFRGLELRWTTKF